MQATLGLITPRRKHTYVTGAFKLLNLVSCISPLGIMSNLFFDKPKHTSSKNLSNSSFCSFLYRAQNFSNNFTPSYFLLLFFLMVMFPFLHLKKLNFPLKLLTKTPSWTISALFLHLCYPLTHLCQPLKALPKTYFLPYLAMPL